ncbi:MAG: PEP-CTERM sorting domain-containing protein [Pyrinomonadaceae bacterium]|nr:PEP-CTERM sorting domain-containing protein [Pyrinomonadaceae bacterium]
MTHFRIHYCLLAFALLAFLSVPARADLITFTSRPAFNAAAPGLPVETFESASVPPGGVATCNGPVSSAMGGGCFPIGGLLPGAVYNASVLTPGNLVVLGAGFPGVGNTSRVLGPNSFAATLNLTFANANAVGFDVFPGPAAGNVAITVFDGADVLIGTFSVLSPVGGTFFGVINTMGNIGRINIASQSTAPGELVDNVAFGTAGAAVPEPMTVLLLGSGLAGLAAKVRRRRKSLSD